MPRLNVIDESDAIELVAAVMGKDPDANDFDEDACITAFEERFSIDVETFAELATELAKFTIPTDSPLRPGKQYQGFVMHKEGRYICKIEVE